MNAGTLLLATLTGMVFGIAALLSGLSAWTSLLIYSAGGAFTLLALAIVLAVGKTRGAGPRSSESRAPDARAAKINATMFSGH